MEFVIGFLYPKLDSNVSAQLNHLLKCPFNIHRSSHKVSLPIVNMHTFDIDSCVTVDKLLLEMQNPSEDHQFLRSLEHFKKFIKNLNK